MGQLIESIRIVASVLSHIGCIRPNNEDNFFLNGDYMEISEMNSGACMEQAFSSPTNLFAVFDGMGGQNAGERASFIAASNAMQLLPDNAKIDKVQEQIEARVEQVSSRVWKDGIHNGTQGQGTTLALLLVQGNQAIITNVGDSRVYIVRKQQLFLLSKDHTKIHEQVLAGEMTLEEERLHPENNILTHYIGMNPQRMPMPLCNTRRIVLCRGDRFLLCSDGLTDLLSHDTIRNRLNSMAAPLDAVRALTKDALEMGGKDNITCMVLDVLGGEGCDAPTSIDLTKLTLQSSSVITQEVTQ